ncbi:RNA polymerase sigma factor [Stutzerimonas kirkiae]|uniref:RNA polymerase sigma factor n=1 Tax=Stutzerimonas kirkiae TaxID=2211392 RepID=A0A4Q9QZ25_9GAMM|nr:sigma-70 family RNA polymerase sigma factor [Stutzerimonas kirkiae]TBU90656.1 RNA polymerase sigma factor [Stutzerimonas kirkiae]TBV00168.1 RNA polymerase sigma factor [Stutzerimonas kirkiae]TBV04781.1 RNA polymerase sigma factor [Stutzerimonas kirkiae]TBV14053.1 RNA polymerase sigma factor [Stutzerimonas kirkiae]
MTDADLKALFLAHRDELQVYLRRRVGCQETAADLTQETFLKLAEREDRSRIESVRAYLFQSARNLLVDHRRRERYRQGEELTEEQRQRHEPLTPPLEQRIAASEQLERLYAIIQAMPPRCREVFLLVRLEGLTYARIGERLGISPKTAFSHMVRALELLEQHTRELP